MLTKEEEEVISKEISRIQKKLIHPETNDEKVGLNQLSFIPYHPHIGSVSYQS